MGHFVTNGDKPAVTPIKQDELLDVVVGSASADFGCAVELFNNY